MVHLRSREIDNGSGQDPEDDPRQARGEAAGSSTKKSSDDR